MKPLGRVSASQVIACFRRDFAIRMHGLSWPKSVGEATADMVLPIQRMAVVAKARGPWAFYFILECTWTAYEVSDEEIMRFRAWTTDAGSKTVAERIADYRRDPTTFGDAAALSRVADLRAKIRSGDLDLSVLVAATADAARVPYPHAPAGSHCLVDGNHRMLALSEEGRMPKSLTVFVGDAPDARLGMAVLNGRLPASGGSTSGGSYAL